MVTEVEEVKNLVELRIERPDEAFPEIKQMPQSDDWKVREVAATCLVEMCRKRPQEVVAEMTAWVEDRQQGQHPQDCYKGAARYCQKETSSRPAHFGKGKKCWWSLCQKVCCQLVKEFRVWWCRFPLVAVNPGQFRLGASQYEGISHSADDGATLLKGKFEGVQSQASIMFSREKSVGSIRASVSAKFLGHYVLTER